MLFQRRFAIITPALISGAIAERMKFSAYLVFVTLKLVDAVIGLRAEPEPEPEATGLDVSQHGEAAYNE